MFFGDCEIREAEKCNTEITEVGHLIQNIYGSEICSTMDYINNDKNICTDQTLIELNDIIKANSMHITDQVKVSDDVSQEECVKVDNKDVLHEFKTIEAYGQQVGDVDFYESISKLKSSYVQSKALQCKQKQTSIFDYMMKLF